MAKQQRVEAVERAFEILEAFSDGATQLTLQDLVRRTGFYRSTILRLSGSLIRYGYLFRQEDGRFRLGATPLRLGMLYQQGFELGQFVRPVLARLVEGTEETASFYIREGERRVCLFRHHTPRLIRHVIEEGGAMPLDKGASSHVLQAFSDAEGTSFDAIRAAGYCISMGERDPDIAAVAVPVFGQGHRLLGALNISGLRGHFDTEEYQQRSVTLLLSEAAALSRQLGDMALGLPALNATRA